MTYSVELAIYACSLQVTSLVDIIAIPDVIPMDDIIPLKNSSTVTTIVVQWKEPEYYNAPITIYTLNVCQKVNDRCRNDTMDINATEHTNGGIVRYGLFLLIVDVVICSYLHMQV